MFVIEGLVSLLKKIKEEGKLQGHQMHKNAPSISHLLFNDDSVLLCEATHEHAIVLMDVLSCHERASSQLIDFNKSSVMFAKGTPSLYVKKKRDSY